MQAERQVMSKQLIKLTVNGEDESYDVFPVSDDVYQCLEILFSVPSNILVSESQFQARRRDWGLNGLSYIVSQFLLKIRDVVPDLLLRSSIAVRDA